MTARLLAYARISPGGVLSALGAHVTRKGWPELGDVAPGPLGLPVLRARWFFDSPFSKFGRMDPLCKAAVACSQLVAAALPADRDEVAQVGGTMLGCLEADAQFEATRRAGNPSPALFVYTLPSMFQGEVAILHRLRGRCTLLSAGALSGLAALATAVRWIEKGRARHVLAIAADAAGPAAQAIDPSREPQTAAAAWLLSGEGGRLGIGNVRYNAPRGNARELAPGSLRHGLTFVDTLEPLLLGVEPGAVWAGHGGSSVAFDIAG
ncbi:MAG: hypothetical protein KF696_08615 [Planctomycetes bacterium]|nr:hypothetical protein [Planctomycetota bacterium]MCW8135587.1 hypothetical protein [Planctomycetota bacterium]